MLVTEDFEKLLRRVDTVERNASDISRTITEIATGTAAIDLRVKVLEGIQQDRRVSDVERSAREQAMQKDISTIQSDMLAIRTGINKLLWGLAGSVGAAAVAFVVRGGLSG